MTRYRRKYGPAEVRFNSIAYVSRSQQGLRWIGSRQENGRFRRECDFGGQATQCLKLPLKRPSGAMGERHSRWFAVIRQTGDDRGAVHIRVSFVDDELADVFEREFSATEV